ncbi:hypothetical protein FTO74_18435 [Granulicella sp. WH15]|uniref:hypothetical protein n=1 Tax=Granulicella sp. WH15 TaxID=2602070 RepID=UPI0013677E33|nr:hypothetical protein [Granulicella sp. WH15]QHN05102.1 hypothetical protein FTO74_18435 [Granulicella sp. WH15]
MRFQPTILKLCSLLCLCFSISTCLAGAPPQASQPVLSDASLQALQRANAYGATLFHISPPGPQFIAQMRRAIPKDYPGMDQGMRQGLASIEHNQPYLNSYFAHTNQQQLASFVQTYRAKILASPDPVEQQVRLAEVMAFSAMTAYRKSQSGGGSAAANGYQQLQMETLKQKQLEGGMRSYSPLCNPTRADASSNFQSCHP